MAFKLDVVVFLNSSLSKMIDTRSKGAMLRHVTIPMDVPRSAEDDTDQCTIVSLPCVVTRSCKVLQLARLSATGTEDLPRPDEVDEMALHPAPEQKAETLRRQLSGLFPRILTCCALEAAMPDGASQTVGSAEPI